MPGRMKYDPRPVGTPVALGWPMCPYWQQLATPWPVARHRSHDGVPCVGQSPPVDPRPLPGPRREEGTPCVAAGCTALELVDCSAGRAGGQRGRRCACWYGRRGALPAGAGGENPRRKSTMGAACRDLLSRRSHCVTRCAAKPSSILTISSRAQSMAVPSAQGMCNHPTQSSEMRKTTSPVYQRDRKAIRGPRRKRWWHGGWWP